MRVHPPTRTLLGIVAGATVTALFGASLAVPAQAAGPIDRSDADLTARKIGDGKAVRAIPDKWFVQVSGSPVLRGGSKVTAKSRQSSVQRAASDAGVKFSVLHSFTRTWNGFSVKATKEQVARLQAMPGVTKVFPVYTVSLPKGTVKPDLAYSIPTIGADIAQVFGYDGAGIKVGVIDTGVDYNHVDLGGSGTPGNNADFGPNAPRVKYGWDYVGDDYDPDDPAHADPIEDPYPDDACNGHGTHVAGTVGADGDVADGGVLGVAPKVTLGAYRVLGCSGSGDTDGILAAMDQASADGMDVINLSLGSAFDTWPDYPDAAAASALTAAGTIVVASAGNSADSGLFSSGSPGVGKDVISVASVENTHITLNYFTVSPVPAAIDGNVGYAPAEGAPLPDDGDTGTLAVGRTADGTEPNTYGCEPFASLTGKTVLIQRGPKSPAVPCSFYEKALNAQNAGAAGVVIYNNTVGVLSPTVVPDEGAPITIPTVFTTEADGLALVDQVASQTTTLEWTAETEAVNNPLSGTVSDFSSFGMAADLTLTPDVAAPGGNIWSTYPIEMKGHTNLSGTSMASPHVAGAVALILQAAKASGKSLKGNLAAIRAALQNTSTPIRLTGDYYEPAIRQGAGLIHVEQAILAALVSTTVTPGKISLRENRSSYYKTKLTLTNRGTEKETYKLSVQNALNVGPAPTTYWYDYNDRKVSAKFSPSSVTVKPGKTATVSVSIKQPSKLTSGWIYGGWVKLTRSDKKKTLVVPFAGMYGDYQKVKVLQDLIDVNSAGTALEIAADLPALSKSKELDDIVAPGATRPSFSMDGGDVPRVLFHFEYPVSNAYFNIYKATSSGKKGAEVFSGHKTFLELGQWGRDDYYVSLPFDGKIPFNNATTAGLTVPDGDYVFELRVLKALGNPKTSSHWETWVSPAFTIDRTP